MAIWSGLAPRKSQPRVTITCARAKSGTTCSRASGASPKATSSASAGGSIACQTRPDRASTSAAIWRAIVGEATGPVSSRAPRPSVAIASPSAVSKASQLDGAVPR